MTESLMHYREQAANALYPFIAAGVSWDENLGRAVAYEAIDGYAPKTPREIQLSAQIVACSFAAIACLRSAMAAKNLSLAAILRLQEAALKLDDDAAKATAALETRQRERESAPQFQTAESVAWDHVAFNRTMSVALKRMREADSKIPEILPKPIKPKLRIVASEPMTTSVLAALAGKAPPPEGTKKKHFKPQLVN
ncbi:MAG TPA: hypothetical protein VFG62_01710 [Rhodopila sp.]|jgi:hypothetical protein|nr:hypothetical protein [Rhodopila sp.]